MTQIWSSNNHQGFSYRQFGPSDRVFVDFEGLALIKRTQVRCPVAEKSDTTSN